MHTITKATLFALSLLIICFICMTVIVRESGPFVLGTELNGNGTIEYLCLGTGCEDYADMDW
mgnify:CR=1 FL=1